MVLFSVYKFPIYLVHDEKNIVSYSQINQGFDLCLTVEITRWITGVTDQYGPGLISNFFF